MVSAPLTVPMADVETVLQDKANWITKKLDQWQDKKSLELIWSIDSTFPLLGEPWVLSAEKPGEIKLVPLGKVNNKLAVGALSEWLIEQLVMNWYQDKAIECFEQRLTLYAQKLGISRPPFRLSNAKTRWGSCNSRGVVHLNWRLIQMPLHLVDYIVAHELSHLLEMNHSAVFWQRVKSIYPNYLDARKELKRYC